MSEMAEDVLHRQRRKIKLGINWVGMVPVETQDQHYIPRLYLKGATDREGVLWVYEKLTPIKSSKPKHEAHHPDYYTHSVLGYRDEEAEKTLARCPLWRRGPN